jgi:hypothetical protein
VPDATDVAWIRRVVLDEYDTSQSRWPSDPAWKVVQSATFAEAPAEARRLLRRKQQGADVSILDGVQYGCLASRVAKLHQDGGQWTLSRAIREALPQLEAVEREQGIEFGELVRERRRQRGLPLPILDKVLPFRTSAMPEATHEDAPPIGEEYVLAGTDPRQVRVALAEERMEEAFAMLQEAELRGSPTWTLERLEEAYHIEEAAFRAAAMTAAPATCDVS